MVKLVFGKVPGRQGVHISRQPLSRLVGNELHQFSMKRLQFIESGGQEFGPAKEHERIYGGRMGRLVVQQTRRNAPGCYTSGR